MKQKPFYFPFYCLVYLDSHLSRSLFNRLRELHPWIFQVSDWVKFLPLHPKKYQNAEHFFIYLEDPSLCLQYTITKQARSFFTHWVSETQPIQPTQPTPPLEIACIFRALGSRSALLLRQALCTESSSTSCFDATKILVGGSKCGPLDIPNYPPGWH